MSITYPEAQPSAAARRASSAAVMESGSALFPGRSTAAATPTRTPKARGASALPLAWIAAPVAVVLIGGAVYLSTAHHSAAPTQTTTASSTTAAAPAPAPALKVEQAAPAAAPGTSVHTHQVVQSRSTQTAERMPTLRAARPAPVHHAAVERSTSVTRSDAAPMTAPAPAALATPAPATAPTPGTFNFTAPAPSAPAASAQTPVTTTSDTTTTTTPAASTAGAATTDQSSPPQG